MDTDSKTPPQTPPKRRKITKDDVEDLAKLMAKRIDESGACHMLGIKPMTWFKWKSKEANKAKFAEILSRVREAKLNACLEAIDEAGDGNAEKGQRPDWRAKAWLAERVLAPERYQQKVAEADKPAPVLVAISSEVAANVFGRLLGGSDQKALPPVDIGTAQPTNK